MKTTADKTEKRRYCVLGHNIAYSLSPRLHKSIFGFLGEDGRYDVADVPPEKLEDTVYRLLNEYDGFNITKPYKEQVAQLLGHDGPVNTVRSDKRATSTDPVGFLSDYTEAFGAPQGDVLLLGAGGAAKSVADALESVPSVKSVSVYNRTFEKAEQMARGKIVAVKSAAGRYDAVINGTSLGLGGEQSAPEELDFSGVQYAYDLVYSPAVTPFMVKAKAAGARAMSGLGMLVWQAIAAHEFWRGKRFDDETKTELAAFVKKELGKNIK